jgi:predicted transcriptional regulator
VLRAKSHTPITQLITPLPAPQMSRPSLSAITHNDGWVNHDVLPVFNLNRQLVGPLRYADLRRCLALFSHYIAVKSEDNIWTNISAAYGGSFRVLPDLLSSGNTRSHSYTRKNNHVNFYIYFRLNA